MDPMKPPVPIRKRVRRMSLQEDPSDGCPIVLKSSNRVTVKMVEAEGVVVQSRRR